MSYPSAWSYGRAPAGTEYALWSGDAAPDLAVHFHAEAQLTIVLAGGRAFQIGAHRCAALAGQCLYIPPRVPHRSLPLVYRGTRCVNLYLPGLRLGPQPRLIGAPDLAHEIETAGLATAMQRLERRYAADGEPAQAPPPRAPGLRGGAQTIGAIAARAGWSREGFSRRFARAVGMPPHAYRIVDRLNEARRRLREGEPIAGLAAELDFADQSHFGRQFRRAFGVTPRAYRESLR